MNEMQKRRSTKLQPGCMGKMVKLFDMDGGTPGNKLLMDKPHNDGYAPRSYPIDLVMPSEGELIVSQFGKTSGRTPMKMHLDHELSKEVGSRYTPPNLVARLMGLDTVPKRQVDTFSKRKDACGSTMMGLEEAWPYEPDLLVKVAPHEDEQCPDEFVSYAYHQQAIIEDEKDVALAGQKYVEARHLVTNENLNGSEESEGLVEILKSNKDLFLEFLQQPNSLFAQHLHEMSTHPPSGTKRITVLKPSKTADNLSFHGKKMEKWVTKPTQVSQTHVWNKSNFRGLPISSNWKADDDPQPTRIVVLKPSLDKTSHIDNEYTSPSLSPRTPHGENCFMEGMESDARQSRDMAKEITNIIRENLGSLQMDDSVFSSVLSSGYNGDESSPDKSENEYAAGSDSEAMSPTSRFSWGYADQFASCSSSVSHVRHARESSVCREAKKRLSRRWNAMGLNGNSQEQRHGHSSNTLREMLALSEVKMSIRSPDNNEEEPIDSNTLKEYETTDYSPRNLMMSKSVPLSTDGNYEWVNDRLLHSEVTIPPNEKELLKTSSLKSLVTSLLFSRNKKPDKDNSNADLREDGSSATPFLMQRSHIEEIADGTCSYEVGLSVTKPVMNGNLMESQDQPSPISVLEPFIYDDSRSADSSDLLSTEHPVIKTSASKTNSPMLGKSPPIESVARTSCWNNSYADTASACPFNLSLVCSGPEEEQDWCILVQALLSTVGVSTDILSDACMDWWCALPLDLLLRDTFVNATNQFMHEAKRRRWRSNRKLIFDSVNEALKEISQLELVTNIKNSTRNTETGLPILVDQVWATMSQWISDKARCVCSDDEEDINHNLVVERVVRREVADKTWVDGTYTEINRVGNAIEQRLLDELLEEAVLQLTARYYFTCNISSATACVV